MSEKIPAQEAEEALDATYAALAASENDEDRAFHRALRARRGKLSAPLRVAYEASRAVDGASFEELFLERHRRTRGQYRRLLDRMKAEGVFDLKELHEISAQGHTANELIADYYDSLTEEDWAQEWEDGEEVTPLFPPGGARISFAVSFNRDELKRIRAAVGDGHDLFLVMHDAVMETVATLEHIAAHLAQMDREVTGS